MGRKTGRATEEMKDVIRNSASLSLPECNFTLLVNIVYHARH